MRPRAGATSASIACGARELGREGARWGGDLARPDAFVTPGSLRARARPLEVHRQRLSHVHGPRCPFYVLEGVFCNAAAHPFAPLSAGPPARRRRRSFLRQSA
eukprot:4657610-Pyramimonas_sp.AAC.1